MAREVKMSRKTYINQVIGVVLIFMFITIYLGFFQDSGTSSIEGYVKSVDSESILICYEEDDIWDSGSDGDCWLYIGEDTEFSGADSVSEIVVGDYITAYYSGDVQETYPVQIEDVVSVVVE